MKQAQFTRTLLAGLALAVSASVPFSAMASEATFMPADANKDGFVSRQEFMDYQGSMWDKMHGEMMKKDKAMKADMMDMKQYRQFNSSIRSADGRVDPGKVGGK